MKRLARPLCLCLCLTALAACSRPASEAAASGAPPIAARKAGKPLAITQLRSQGAQMVVSSPAFTEGGAIPDAYTTHGQGVPPPVMWTPVPGARGYVVVVEDPDARGPAAFVHWIVYDIPLTATALADPSAGAALPDGARQGRATLGAAAYAAPEPPAGDPPHRYFFEVFALDAAPDVGEAPDLASLERAMTGHVLGDGETVGLYPAPPKAAGNGRPHS